MNSSQNLNFQIQPIPIDYFKLEEDYFEPYCNVSKEVITLSANETYIEYPKHFPNLDLDKKETIVFNFPVGKGKTTICYDLIDQYVNRGYCVIVCSPFTKLVNKDFDHLQKIISPVSTTGMVTGRTLEVCKYTDLEATEAYFTNAPHRTEILAEVANVHIMTINCFIGNPGENAFEQSFLKQNYLQRLFEATGGKKVVLFIDELHESIHNFESAFIANLLKWKDKVQKAYIASATFTPATVPAIKAVSLLTDKNVHIYEIDRYKNQQQADIYLHITPYTISGYNGDFLTVISQEIKLYKDAGKTVNILTGTKHLAEKIADRSFKHVIKSENQIGRYTGSDTIHLLTSDTELNYQVNQNNIGTTFKTGVDITNPGGVLFIVIPTITNSLNSQHYGIFTDGLPAIVQAIGRLRNGGDLHIFISEPNLLIDQTNTIYPSEISNKKDILHELQNIGYPLLKQVYDNKVQQISGEIKNMEEGIFTTVYANSSLENQKNEFSLWYPNFHEFLLEKGQKVLVTDSPSFGKYLAPYILWACLNDQFQNATLNEIVYHQPSIRKLNVPASNRISFIQNLLFPLNGKMKHQSFRSFVDGFSDYLKQSEDEKGEIYQHEYVINNKGVFSSKLMKDHPGLVGEILEEVIFIKTNSRISLSKREYILSCLFNIQQGNVYHEIKVREAYRQLLELRDKYLNWLNEKIVHKDGKTYLPAKLYAQFPSNIFHEAYKVFSLLKKNDPLIGNKVISVMQNLKDEETDNNRKKICTELDELFVLRSDTRKMIEGFNYYELPKDYIQKLENFYQTPLL